MKSILILQNEIHFYRKALYNALSKKYKITILHSGWPSIKTDDLYDEIIIPKIKIFSFNLQSYIRIRRLIKNYDIVIAMFDLSWPGYLWPLFIRNRPKYILWGHRYSKNKLACLVRDFLMQKADGLLMYGDEDIEQMRTRGIEMNKISIAWNTIHVQNHADYSNEKKQSFLFVGRLQESKRIDLIIKCFHSILDEIPHDTILEIVGAPAVYSKGIDDQLKKLVLSLGISQKVYFHGEVHNQDSLAMIFSRAYAYVSPSPVGLGVLHSFAYGIPVITLRNEKHGPEFLNLYHNINSIICDNQMDLKYALKKISNDKTLSIMLGHNAYVHYISKRSLNSMLSGFNTLIEN